MPAQPLAVCCGAITPARPLPGVDQYLVQLLAEVCPGSVSKLSRNIGVPHDVLRGSPLHLQLRNDARQKTGINTQQRRGRDKASETKVEVDVLEFLEARSHT